MDNYLVSSEDIQYLVSESNNNLNMILAGMTYVMEDNNDKVSMLENQTWFQRMSKTITGKNKMTQDEIARNHDKINLYVTQALAELFNRNCIDHEIMRCLGNKINELYESQIEIKQIIGAFAQKLNQKIESIDNYHMLVEELNQGLYDGKSNILSISEVMSQLDLRTVQDNRKMDILKRAFIERKIINDHEILFIDFLEELLYVGENEAGILALFFGNIRKDYVAEMIEKVITSYYMLPEKFRKMKNRRSIVAGILHENDIDEEYKITTADLCDSIIEAYTENIIQCEVNYLKENSRTRYDTFFEWINDVVAIVGDTELLIGNLCCFMKQSYKEDLEHTARHMARLVNNILGKQGEELVKNLKEIENIFRKVVAMYPMVGLDSITVDKDTLGENLYGWSSFGDSSFDMARKGWVNQRGDINVNCHFDENQRYIDGYVSLSEHYSQSVPKALNSLFGSENVYKYLHTYDIEMTIWQLQAGDLMGHFFFAYYKAIIENLEKLIGTDYEQHNALYDLPERYHLNLSCLDEVWDN